MALVTYLDLQNQIANDLRRSNLTSEIAQAILDAIADHDSEQFWFNDELTPYQFQVTQDDTFLAPIGNIQEFIKVKYVRAQPVSTGLWYTLKPAENFEIEVLRSTASSGQPSRWAMLGTGTVSTPGNTFRVWPTPANQPTGYPVKIFGHYRLPPLVNATDTNAWTTWARNLIRYTALKRLYVTPIRDMNMMQLMEAAGVRELEYLRRETERRKKQGRMRPYG